MHVKRPVLRLSMALTFAREEIPGDIRWLKSFARPDPVRPNTTRFRRFSARAVVLRAAGPLSSVRFVPTMPTSCRPRRALRWAAVV